MNHQEKQEEERLVWKKRISDLTASRMTVAEFGKVHALSIHQIYYWKAKFSEPQTDLSPAPAKPKSNSPAVKILPKEEIKSSKLPDPKWIAELIKAIHEVF